jgi:hypothetical protein
MAGRQRLSFPAAPVRKQIDDSTPLPKRQGPAFGSHQFSLAEKTRQVFMRWSNSTGFAFSWAWAMRSVCLKPVT